MKYQVLARKYRPQDFDTLMGQEHVRKALENALTTGRLHHAYLFTGTRGVGKTTIARVLAKALNCEQGVVANPCGQCDACLEIEQGRFVDLIEVDAASRTKVEDTRELLENVQYAPVRGRYKIYLIDEVHMLSGHSFNALLKTLEEPPEHVKFLLATTDPQKLPVTVLSRCLKFNLKRLSVGQIVQQLENILSLEQLDFEPAALKPIAIAADGSMRDALSLMDQAIAFGAGQILRDEVENMLGNVSAKNIFQLLNALAQREANTLVETLRSTLDFGMGAENILNEMINVLQQVALFQLVPDAINDSHYPSDALSELAQQISAEDLQLFYQIALTGRQDIELSPFPQGALEMIMLRMLAFQPVAQGVGDTANVSGNTIESKKKQQILTPKEVSAEAKRRQATGGQSSPAAQAQQLSVTVQQSSVQAQQAPLKSPGPSQASQNPIAQGQSLSKPEPKEQQAIEKSAPAAASTQSQQAQHVQQAQQSQPSSNAKPAAESELPLKTASTASSAKSLTAPEKSLTTPEKKSLTAPEKPLTAPEKTPAQTHPSATPDKPKTSSVDQAIPGLTPVRQPAAQTQHQEMGVRSQEVPPIDAYYQDQAHYQAGADQEAEDYAVSFFSAPEQPPAPLAATATVESAKKTGNEVRSGKTENRTESRIEKTRAESGHGQADIAKNRSSQTQVPQSGETKDNELLRSSVSESTDSPEHQKNQTQKIEEDHSNTVRSSQAAQTAQAAQAVPTQSAEHQTSPVAESSVVSSAESSSLSIANPPIEENSDGNAYYRQWHEIIKKMDCTGLERELFMHSSLLDKNDENHKITLKFGMESAHKALLDDKIMPRLKQKLEAYFDREVKVEFVELSSQESAQFLSPKQQDLKNARQRLEDAQKAMNEDESVQMILECFGGKIIQESIKPV